MDVNAAAAASATAEVDAAKMAVREHGGRRGPAVRRPAERDWERDGERDRERGREHGRGRRPDRARGFRRRRRGGVWS
ncbi:hypothetical protein CXF45_09810 [Corynebacterium bovis]|nr:hypothetical protein CXF45_09810 [Corynebacterium bovis]